MARGTAFLSSRGLRQLVPIFRAERGNQIAVIYAARKRMFTSIPARCG